MAAIHSQAAGRLARRRSFLARGALKLRVRCSRRRLDAELAAGNDPMSRPALALRATQLLDPRNRRRLAADLERLVSECRAVRAGRLSAAVPVVCDEVLKARRTLIFLADLLRFADRVKPRGVAMLMELLRDGGSALYVRSGRGALMLELQSALEHLTVEPPASRDAGLTTSRASDGGPLGRG